MMAIKFNDGVVIETHRPPQTLMLADGWYAVGNGHLIPCVDKKEAEAWVARLKAKEWK